MNPITIEQTQEEMALAFHVHGNAAISAVRLSRAKLASRPLGEELKGPIAIKFVIKSRSVDAPKGMLRVEVDFRMIGELEAKPGAEGKPVKKRETVVSVECTYEVDYQLREGFEPSAKEVKAFKDGNVIFNCWPYFREYLQESVQRMGFPALTAPFLRVQPKPPKAEKKTERKLTER